MCIKNSGIAAFLFLFFTSYTYAASVTGSGVLDVTGSDVWIDSHDQSTVNVWPGSTISYLDSYNQSHANVYGGDISWLRMHDSSTANIYDGTPHWIILTEFAKANVYKGGISWLILDGTSTADIYVSNYSYSVNGILSGQWSDGTNFSFWLQNGPLGSQISPAVLGSNVFIHTVPVPTSLVLLMSGIFLLGFTKKGKGLFGSIKY